VLTIPEDVLMQWSGRPGRIRALRADTATAADVQSPGGSDGYTGMGNLEVMDCAVKYQRFLAELLTAAAGPPGTERAIVDFGAGVGTLARAARSLGWQVTCVELDPALQARLRADGFDVAASLDDISPRSVDFLYSCNVLEHIEDDATVVSAFHRVLKPGTPLLLYVPAFPVLYSSMDRLVGHVRRYRRKGLVDLVESAGFTVETCRYADSIGFAASLAYRAIGNDSGKLDERAVRLYDRSVFPASRRLDHLAHRFFGKNLVLTARRSGG
jgi:SAM-dependent methyltransferase